MSITVKKELDFNDLLTELWECDFVLGAVTNNDLEEEFMEHIESMFFMSDCDVPTITELNDYVRFEWENIFDSIGLNEDGEVAE